MRLREEATALQAQLSKCEPDARRVRQSVLHLEADAQSKAQWKLQWAREVASKAGDGPAGVSWASWKSFLDRGILEVGKTRRLLAGSATSSDAEKHSLMAGRAEAQKVHEALRLAEEALRCSRVENARLVRTLRFQESETTDRKRTSRTVELLRRELATAEDERLQCEADEERLRTMRFVISEETDVARCELQSMPVQQMKRHILRTAEQSESMESKMKSSIRELAAEVKAASDTMSEELEELRAELACESKRLVRTGWDADEINKELAQARESLKEEESEQKQRSNHNSELVREARAEAARRRGGVEARWRQTAGHVDMDDDLGQDMDAVFDLLEKENCDE
jgi:hypothetical protein